MSILGMLKKLEVQDIEIPHRQIYSFETSPDGHLDKLTEQHEEKVRAKYKEDFEIWEAAVGKRIKLNASKKNSVSV